MTESSGVPSGTISSLGRGRGGGLGRGIHPFPPAAPVGLCCIAGAARGVRVRLGRGSGGVERRDVAHLVRADVDHLERARARHEDVAPESAMPWSP